MKMTRLRQTIARRLKEAQNSAAMLTTFNDVDMSEVMELRKRHKDAFENQMSPKNNDFAKESIEKVANETKSSVDEVKQRT